MNELIRDKITPFFEKVFIKLTLLETRINTIEKKCDSLYLTINDINNKIQNIKDNFNT